MNPAFDDIFDEEADPSRLEEVSLGKLKEARLKDGLRDGISEGGQSTLQEGFNIGYAEGYQHNFPVAMVRGIMGALKSYLKKRELPEDQRIADISVELAEFEKKLVEVRKSLADEKSKSRADSGSVQSLDETQKIDKTSSEAKESERELASNLSALAVVKRDNLKVYGFKPDKKPEISRCNISCNCKVLVEQFHFIKKNSIAVLEEFGFTKLSELIEEVSCSI